MNFTYLVVEGAHDAAFAGKILKRAGCEQIKNESDLNPYWKKLVPTTFPHKGDLLKRVPIPAFFQNAETSVAIHDAGGDSKIAAVLEETVASIQPTRLFSIGVLLDADTQQTPQDRCAELQPQLQKHCGTWTGGPGSIHPGSPNTGIFVLPDNQTRGTLEDLLLESAADSWPAVLPHAQQFVRTAEAHLVPKDRSELRTPSGKNKAVVASIGALLRPGKTIAVSISDNNWLQPNLLSHQALITFLHQLTGLSNPGHNAKK